MNTWRLGMESPRAFIIHQFWMPGTANVPLCSHFATEIQTECCLTDRFNMGSVVCSRLFIDLLAFQIAINAFAFNYNQHWSCTLSVYASPYSTIFIVFILILKGLCYPLSHQDDPRCLTTSKYVIFTDLTVQSDLLSISQDLIKNICCDFESTALLYICSNIHFF